MDFIGSLIDGLREEMRSGFERQEAHNRTVDARLDGIDARLTTLQTTMQGEFEQVYLRLEAIENALRGELHQLRAEVFRLRAAVYLLAKDRPEILKLLGQEPQEQ